MLKYGLVQDKDGYYLVSNDALAEDSWVMISTDDKFGYYPPSKVIEFPYDGYFIFEDTMNGFRMPSIRIEKHRGWLILAAYNLYKLDEVEISRSIMHQTMSLRTETAKIELRLEFTRLFNGKNREE